jgi:hypothetical protein
MHMRDVVNPAGTRYLRVAKFPAHSKDTRGEA